jgi:hypothetical protein
MLSAVGNYERPNRASETSTGIAPDDQGDTEDVPTDAEREDVLSDDDVRSDADAGARSRAPPSVDSSSRHRTDLSAMQSSIHAIHRPLEWQRRHATEPALALSREHAAEQYAAGHDAPEVDAAAVPIEPTPVGPELREVDEEGEGRPLSASRRSTGKSSATMPKAERRAVLAGMLKDIFGLQDVEDVVAEMPCWLFRSVLLQGYLYLTTGHICFYAYVRNKEVCRRQALSRCSAG